MSTTPLQDPPTQGVSPESGQTLASRPLQPIPDPSSSKRVYFYKSGDLKFSGHRMVINARTFKTFDALLDTLSKKVPLPFGVRIITTPRGTHLIKGLGDLQDGGSYVCSDQKKVKPIDLDAVNRRQVPWNTTRPISARRKGRQGFPLSKGNVAASRPARITDRVAVRTPKRLVVIKNRDPTVKRTVVLQKRTAPTFDALLDYLSQIMQFPVLKLYSADGRRVDGLAALILCSGIIIAAGNEHFRLGNQMFDIGRTGQTVQSVYSDTVEPTRLQPLLQKNKYFSSGRSSRNFSVSSERYIVNQINKSLSGRTTNQSHHRSASFETVGNQRHESIDDEACEHGQEGRGRQACIVPQDEDIEKSFRVNQDGSMTVEMKVRLTIKEEEMLHWTTTLSRTSLSQKTTHASVNNSPDSNIVMAKDPLGAGEYETKEENHPTLAGKGVGFSDERGFERCSTATMEKPKSGSKRTPTPGPRHTQKKASIESIKMVTESGVQESSLGRYSYMERTADGEVSEEYCVVRQSSSSNRPIPKPRKTASAGASNRDSHSSIRSSGVAEVLQIQNNGMEITETVMHIYERQGCYDNFNANEEYSPDGMPEHGSSTRPQGDVASMDSGPRSSSNDCDVDFTRGSSTSDTLNRCREEILSLSSDPISPSHEISNNLSSFTSNTALSVSDDKTETLPKDTKLAKQDNTTRGEKKKKIATTAKPTGKEKSSSSTSNSDKKLRDTVASSSKSTKLSSADRLSNTTLSKKNGSTSGSDKNGQKSKGTEGKKVVGDDNTATRKQALSLNIENVKGASSKKQLNLKQRAAKDNGHNVDTPETGVARPPMKKNILDILQPKRSTMMDKKAITKQRSMNEKRLLSPKQTLELSESVSMPSLNPTTTDVHQYVENWLQKITPDSVPYMEDSAAVESEPKTKVVFQIGGDSESECQANVDDDSQTPGGECVKSMSCLVVPQNNEGPCGVVSSTGQRAKGLCSSMPSVRIDPVDQESRLRMHASAEAIGPVQSESPSYTSSLLSPNMRIKPVLRQLCSSIQCIRRATEPEPLPGLEKSSSLPDFSSQVAAVFGSPSRAFLSFLSAVTLRETLANSLGGDSPEDSQSTSEAMLMVESLQKISTIEDEEELKASLTDLRSRTSSSFRERWRDFQVQRERLESEPLSPKFSEQEFALEVVSEGGDAFHDQQLGIDELMEELDMPPDMREEIVSTFQQTKSFYPEVEDSTTCVEKDKHCTDTEEELELFAKERDSPAKQPLQNDTSCMAETSINEVNNDECEATGNIEEVNEAQMALCEQDVGEGQDVDPDVKESEAVETEAPNSLDVSEKETRVCGSNKSMSGDEEEEEWREKREERSGGEDVEEGEKRSKERIQEKEEEDMAQESGDKETKAKTGEGEDDNDDEVGEVEERGEDEMEDKKDEDEDIKETEEEKHEEDREEEAEEESEVQEEKGQQGVESEEEVDDEQGNEEEFKEGATVEDTEKEEEINSSEEEGLGKENEDVSEKEEELPDEEIEGKGEMEDDKDVGEEEEQNDEARVEEDVIDDHINDTEGEGREEELEQNVGDSVIEDEIGGDDDDDDDEDEDDEGRQAEDEEGERGNKRDIEEMEEEEDEFADDTETDERREAEEEKEAGKEDEGEGEEGNKVETLDDSEVDNDEMIGQEKENEEGTEDEVDVDAQHEVEEEAEEESYAEPGLLQEAAYLFHQSSHEDQANNEQEDTDNRRTGNEIESPPDSKFEEDRGHGTGTTNEIKTDDGEEEQDEGGSFVHPVEISQELLDVVNAALQSSSLVFTYDARGIVRIEPDNTRIVQTGLIVIPKSKEDSSYGLRRLPSPNTSDLSDYRPETSESGGHKSRGSLDVCTESGEERQHSDYRCRTNLESANSLSTASTPELLPGPGLKSVESVSSSDSEAKALGEDLSYLSAASSLRADAEMVSEPAQFVCFPSEANSNDGVLIDKGRWLLKENHLIRKSPPVPLGMYGNDDTTSVDTGQENTSIGSPPCYINQQNPLTVLSSSELEEMAKPPTPKCTYYNMPHGSDSDPFLDDVSVKSGSKVKTSSKGKSPKVSPTVDTSKTWAKKNGSMSSFASVEFKLPDSKVHPEEGPSAVVQAPRSTAASRTALQIQDSLESLHAKCGPYCPIL